LSDLDLVADLAKKSGLVWIRFADRDQAVWHEWVDGAVCVVGEGGEQPLPPVHDGDTVTLLLRSKTNRQLVATVDATTETIAADSPAWDEVTATLRSGRLNLPDMDTAIERWARESRVLRFVPFEPVTLADDLSSWRRLSRPRLSG
jgi:hypothetical protein